MSIDEAKYPAARRNPWVIDGIRHTKKEWSEITGIPEGTLNYNVYVKHMAPGDVIHSILSSDSIRKLTYD